MVLTERDRLGHLGNVVNLKELATVFMDTFERWV